MTRITNVSTTTGYDHQTGEKIYSEETNTLNIPAEPNFVKLYLDDILYLSDLPKGLNSVLYNLLKRMSYGNQIVVNAGIKRQIAGEISLAVSTVNNSITKLVKGHVLFRVETGIYTVNPNLFGKGEWKDIAQLRMHVTYDINGRSFNTEVNKTIEKEEENPFNDLNELFKKGQNQDQDMSSKGEALEVTPKTDDNYDDLTFL